MAAGFTLLIAWLVDSFRPEDITVYNCSTGDHNPLTWRRFNEYADIAWRECPPKEMLWYPTFTCEGNYYKHKIMAFFYHYVPAYIIDTLTRIVGKKPRIVSLHCPH